MHLLACNVLYVSAYHPLLIESNLFLNADNINLPIMLNPLQVLSEDKGSLVS